VCDWVATPVLALLVEHCHVVADEAWLYSGQTRRVCEQAYETTRDALAEAERWNQADPDCRAVVAALKASYRMGIGQMDMTKNRELGQQGTRIRGYRPDVRASIIATHRANSLRAMLWAGKAGRWPLVMARADSVVFASDDPDPGPAWPGRADGMSDRLGKYKVAGTQTMAEWSRLALPAPVSPSRSVWAVTNPAAAETSLRAEAAGLSVYIDGDGTEWLVDENGVVVNA
jgi:hypothetical protein